MTCSICQGEKTVIVGWSQMPRSTYKVKWERDACPGCTPPPHSFHAKIIAQRRLEQTAPEP
jgi:hypothetical protein